MFDRRSLANSDSEVAGEVIKEMKPFLAGDAVVRAIANYDQVLGR